MPSADCGPFARAALRDRGRRRARGWIGVFAAAALALAYSSAGHVSSAWSSLPRWRRSALLAHPLVALLSGTVASPACHAEELRAFKGSAVPASLTYRTQKQAPRIDKVLAIMLLRTTYETVEAWGVYAKMADYQKALYFQFRDTRKAFNERYQNYDFKELFNGTKLKASNDGGVTNRLYFNFLNDAQWHVIGNAISQERQRAGFGALIGEKLYSAIVKGKELKADVPEGQEVTKDSYIGAWPAMGQPTKGRDPKSLADGVGAILGYLQARGYCQDAGFYELEAGGDGRLRFASFVQDPVNFQTTQSLMAEKGLFVPRYDQRILQAYFAECGFKSNFVDVLSDGLNRPQTSVVDPQDATGIRTLWELTYDPAAAEK